MVKYKGYVGRYAGSGKVMKQINKKARIVLAVVLGIVVCFVIMLGAMFGVASKALDDKTPDEWLGKWLDCISDEVLLKDIVIPGSHDAGTTQMMWAAKTQDKTIKEQMECGVRYFDVRPQNKDGDLVIFHGMITGERLEVIIENMRKFLEKNPSEMLIVDFQHFQGDHSVMDMTDKMIVDKLGSMLVRNNTGKSDLDFVSSLKLGDTRGKAIIFWGNMFGDQSNSEFCAGKDYLFQRNNDQGTRDGASLQSFYIGKLNKMSSKAYIQKAIPQYVDMYKQSGGGLFVMQMQLTDPVFIVGPQYREGGHVANAKKFIDTLPSQDYFGIVNIIMRDFLGESKSKQIISLNLPKGVVKQGIEQEFESRLA